MELLIILQEIPSSFSLGTHSCLNLVPQDSSSLAIHKKVSPLHHHVVFTVFQNLMKLFFFIHFFILGTPNYHKLTAPGCKSSFLQHSIRVLHASTQARECTNTCTQKYIYESFTFPWGIII